jgi:hypothetical protein
MHQEHMTTEILRKKFKNNFDLCNLAITVGKNMVMGGNPATLDEILEAVEDRVDEGQG